MIVDEIAALALIRRCTLRAAAIPEADADEPGAGGGRFVEGVKGSPLIVGPLQNRDNYTDCLRGRRLTHINIPFNLRSGRKGNTDMRLEDSKSLPAAGGPWKLPGGADAPPDLHGVRRRRANGSRFCTPRDRPHRLSGHARRSPRRGGSVRASRPLRHPGRFFAGVNDHALIDVARTTSDVAADTQEWFVVYQVKEAPQHYAFGDREVALRPGDVGASAPKRGVHGEVPLRLAFNINCSFPSPPSVACSPATRQ